MLQDPLDKATHIRKGEELNITSLQEFLSKKMPERKGGLVIEQFPGGASNLTYLLRLGDFQMVLRRPPFGANIKSGHDMGREYKVLSALSTSYGKAPKPLVYTEDESVIGSPFYIMERVNGVILRGNGGPAKEMDGKSVFNIAESLMETLAELHALDYEKAGLGELGKPEGYTERQVLGWSKRYFKSKTSEVPNIEKAAKWLNDHIPVGSGYHSLIHNDFKHDNVVLNPKDLTEVIAILDWEMCTLGAPMMDLGTTMGYWMDPEDPPTMKMAFPNPSVLPGNPSRSGLLELYLKKSGREVNDFVFYYVYGLFKIAVIVQQIYYRFNKGLTQDPRFAQMDKIVEALGLMASQAIDKGRIDKLF